LVIEMRGLSALHRKLFREVRQLVGQIVTIALVVAGGITCFISLRGTCDSLDWARAAYYDRYRFADVFAHVERAPESVARQIEALPGVGVVQTRIFEEVTLPIEGMERPAYGRLVSLPASGQPMTNALHIVEGELPTRGSDADVAVLSAFASAHGLHPGHRLPAVIHGKLRQLKVVGVVLSPEFVYAIRPGAIIDDPQRYAVLWMERSVLASAFQLDGAFNDLTLRLQPGASEPEVCAAVDRLLAAYGGDGAFGRSRQISSKMLATELGQLEGIAGMVPLVFLGVAAFLINVVLGRLIALQRPEIAALKAMGYTNGEIARHYLGLVAVVMVPGSALGVALGRRLGVEVTALYGELFRFPTLSFRMSATLVVSAIAVSALAAVAGAILAIRSATRLPPAEAMRPPAPPRYRRSLLERLGAGTLLGPTGLMVVREVGRRPLRTILSSVGIAGAIALIILGHFGADSLDAYLEGTLRRAQRQDLSVAFVRPEDPRVIGQLARVPGILTAEGIRAVPVRVRHDHVMRDSVLMGLPSDATLRRLVERSGGARPVPDEGVVITATLGEILGVRPGDAIELEVLEGSRQLVRPVVAGFIDEAVGLQVYARRDVVDALQHDDGAISSALLRIEPRSVVAVEARLRRSPDVIDVSDLCADIGRLRDMNGSIMDVWTAISITLSACVIFGVAYNNARIALAARERDLATLRVLGMTRGEIAAILIGSLALEVGIAIPLGLVSGRLWAEAFMSNVDKETWRWAVVVAPRTYLLAAAVAIVACAASALWVRRHVDQLDLIGVLKTRE
jgi:putative ABC transport system permease protein